MHEWNRALARSTQLMTAALILAALCGGSFVLARAGDQATLRRIDPAAWGGDHVGKPMPAYVTGDECLFCHRKIGPAWRANRHQMTIRLADPDEQPLTLLRKIAKGDELVNEAKYLMGSRRVKRFLKRSKDYGKLEILSTFFVPKVGHPKTGTPKTATPKTANPKTANRVPDEDGRLRNSDRPHWDQTVFGARCAGCHTTAVNTATEVFSAISTDCFACHGNVDLDHTDDVSRVLLSSQSRKPREVVSICGQCHLRGSKSKSSGLPYPNTFVAGDNLFRDFQVDFADTSIMALPVVDQHIFLNTRNVAIFDLSAVTCLTCHDVHDQSSEKHQQLEDTAICSSCHVPGTGNSTLRDAMLPLNRLRTHSRICDY